MTYKQITILAMELNRAHVGKLVQIITDSWSMTGTLTRVDQHDNREWEIDYASGGGLRPSGGEIYAELWIGPWRGSLIGNQPVTVELSGGELEAPERAAKAFTADQVAEVFQVPVDMVVDDVIKGELEAPERARLREFEPLTVRVTDEELADHREGWPEGGILDVIQGGRGLSADLVIMDEVEGPVKADGTVDWDAPWTVLHYPSARGDVTRCGMNQELVMVASSWELVTCRECQAWRGADDLPPAPVEWPDL